MPDRRLRNAVVAGAAATMTLMAIGLPPAARATRPTIPADPADVRGAYHVHTRRSDGGGEPGAVAAAARSAGLQFVILTDHGDATRPPDPPRYLDGVLVVDAVEISTWSGHYVALGLGAAPYPLAGAAADVAEDVRRLGGIGFVAHPGSPRSALAWRDWSVAFDGLEWLNADSEWRDESWPALGRALFTYPVRPRETLAALLDRPAGVLQQWDHVNQQRAVPALAAADAHARIGERERGESDEGAWHVALPGYAASFGAFSNHVRLDHAWTGEAVADARALTAAIGRGRAYAVIDGIATPGGLRFTATSAVGTAQMGDSLAGDAGVVLHADVSAPPAIALRLLRDGVPVADSPGTPLMFDATGHPGVYRIEATVRDRPGMPWLVSNPIRVGLPAVPPSPTAPLAATETGDAPMSLAGAGTEHSDGSESVLEAIADDPASVTWRYQLAGGVPSGQFAALRLEVERGRLTGATALTLRAGSERPARLWVQVRVPGATDARWGRTVYLDAASRVVRVPLAGLHPLGVGSASQARLDEATSILLVADTLNARPGARGSVVVSEVTVVR